MGCAGSKVQSEEGVARCRKRKRAVKLALRFRNQYAVAQSDYIICLRNLSSALKHFSVGEFREQLGSSSSAAGSSSSSSSTPLPATPTTPLKNREFPDVVISSIKIPPKHLRSNPPAPITVVVSPPKSPDRQRGGVFSRDEEYDRYMAADAPPDGLYEDIRQPDKPRGTGSWFSFWNSGGGGSGGGESSTSNDTYGSSSSPNYTYGSSSYGSSEPEPDSSWDIFGIFQMPPMMYGSRFEDPIQEEDEEEMKRELEEEDVPALEAESPERDKKKKKKQEPEEEIHVRHHHHLQEEEDEDESDHEKLKKKKKKKVDDEPVVLHHEEEMKPHPKHKPEPEPEPEPEHDHEPEPEPEPEPEMRVEEERIPEPPPRKLKGVIIEEIEEEEEEPVLRRRKPAARKIDVPSSSSGLKHIPVDVEDVFKFEEEPKRRGVPQFSPRDFSPRAATPAPAAPAPAPARAPSKELEIWDVLHIIYEQFETVSTLGSDVARLLEPRKTHHGYSLGLSDRIFRVVSRSPRTPQSSSLSEDSSSDDFGSAKFTPGCHATTLDKLYAWEKKLYTEVKDNETISAEFHRKCKQLRKLDERGASSEIIDKTRVSIKVLETQMHVSMEAMKATSRNIQELTDKDLFHQLLELLQASMLMWENMYYCHQKQKQATDRIKSPGSPPLEATSNSHKLATQQLESALNDWHRALDRLVKRQREYLRNMNTWLRLSVYTPERKTEVRVRPPVHNICQAWASALERIAEQKLLDGIKSFAEVIHNVVRLQEDEEKTRRKAESLAKELNRKALSVNNAEKKLVAEGSGSAEAKASLEERKASLGVFRERVEEAREGFTRAIGITRRGTVAILETELPKLFSCLEEFSSSCLAGYREVNHKARNNEFEED